MAKKQKPIGTTLLRPLNPLASAMRSARRSQSGSDKTSPSSARTKASKQKAKQTAKSSNKQPETVKVSPLAPGTFPAIPAIAGITMGTARTGIKYRGRPDLVAFRFAKGTQAAGVFASTTMPGVPVDWCRSLIDSDQGMSDVRGLVVNAGNANVFTGQAGRDVAKASAMAAAKAIGCRQKNVLLASTGLIGEKPPADKMVAGVEKAAGALSGDGWETAARAIMTTDTFAKGSTATAQIDGADITIAGIAKGSGMVAPDMATMLAFLFTDANIASPVLQTLLSINVRHSFNAITVDGDASTSDMVLLIATGKGPTHKPITRVGDRRLADFRRKLSRVMTDLAQQIVRDGEGAGKFITVKVTGAANRRAAKTIALSIANSPLVKTAIAGEDANWGRIVMAVGKSGELAERDKLAIRIGDILVARNGEAHAGYQESRVALHLKGKEIDLEVDVGVGAGEATIWTCDLTHDYIRINADYRS